MSGHTATYLRNLSIDELLNLLEDKKHHSPIILELCNRLENVDIDAELEGVNNRAECPVCQAALHVELDIGNKLYDITIAK